MRITKCVASRPGLFNDLALDLPDGISIIYGRNGSGKSLLTRALVETLCARLDPRADAVPTPWDELYLELHLRNAQHDYRFVRNGDRIYSIHRLSRNGETGVAQAELNAPFDLRDALESAKGDDDAELRRIYGRIDANAFRALSMVPSPTNNSADTKTDMPINQEALRTVFLEDDTQFYAVYRAIKNSFDRSDLSKRMHSLVNAEMLRVEVRLKDIDKKMQIIEIQKSKSEKLMKEKRQFEEDIADAERRIAEIDSQTSLIHSTLEKIARMSEKSERIRSLSEELQEAEHRQQAVRSKEEWIEGKFPQFRGFNEVKKQNLRKLQETYREIRDTHIALENHHTARQTSKRRRHLVSTLLFALCLSAEYWLLGRKTATFFGIDKIYFMTGIAGALLAFVGAMYATLFLPGHARVHRELLQKRAGIEGRLQDILHENGIELYDYRLESVYEFLLQYFEEYGEFTDGQLEVFMLKESLKHPEHLARLREEIEALSQESKSLTIEILNDLGSVKGYTRSEIDENALGACLDEMEEQRRSLISEREGLVKALAQAGEEIGVPVDQSEELASLQSERKRLESKHADLETHISSMDYLLGLFEEVISRREERQIARLVQSARDKFNYITGNQYITAIGEKSIRGFITEGRIADLSTAIAHLLELCASISLSEFLDEAGLSLPLIMDDPFLFMDEKRVNRLKLLLENVARNRQVIIFTQNRHYCDSRAMIEL